MASRLDDGAKKVGWARNGRKVEIIRLALEGEAGTNLVGSLVQVLGIEGSTQAEGDTWAEQDVVGKSSNAAVVDLDLIGERRPVKKTAREM